MVAAAFAGFAVAVDPSFNFGDWGLEFGGEIRIFLLMSISTAAVSKCCCNWLKFFN